MNALEYEKNKDQMRTFVLEDGRCYKAFKTSGFFCKHCTDIIYDFDGPYALICDLNYDTRVPCWSGTCEHFEQEEIEKEPEHEL